MRGYFSNLTAMGTGVQGLFEKVEGGGMGDFVRVEAVAAGKFEVLLGLAFEGSFGSFGEAVEVGLGVVRNVVIRWEVESCWDEFD